MNSPFEDRMNNTNSAYLNENNYNINQNIPLEQSVEQNDFQRQLNNMHQEVILEGEAFGSDENNIHKLLIKNPNAILNRELTVMEKKMLQRIQRVDEYSWNRGASGGLDTGFEEFNDAIEGGVQSGLILFAAAPNVGKSAFALQLTKNISELNDNVYCEYHSKDDSLNDLLPRWIACDQRISIAQAKNPERFQSEPNILDRRNQGLKNLYKNIHRFSMVDQEDTSDNIEDIEARIKELRMELGEQTRIVIGIDSFYDLTTEQNFGNNDRAEVEYIAKTLKSYTKIYDVTIICTAHLRKVGQRRPITDDLKESNKLEFEANLICLLYNEVGVKNEAADIYWLGEDEDLKMPVLEMHFAKNKFSSFKGLKFFEFIPDNSLFIPSSKEASQRYASLVYQS